MAHRYINYELVLSDASANVEPVTSLASAGASAPSQNEDSEANACSYGEAYRIAARGGPYVATTADYPQPSLYVRSRDSAVAHAFKCTQSAALACERDPQMLAVTTLRDPMGPARPPAVWPDRLRTCRWWMLQHRAAPCMAGALWPPTPARHLLHGHQGHLRRWRTQAHEPPCQAVLFVCLG